MYALVRYSDIVIARLPILAAGLGPMAMWLLAGTVIKDREERFEWMWGVIPYGILFIFITLALGRFPL